MSWCNPLLRCSRRSTPFARQDGPDTTTCSIHAVSRVPAVVSGVG